MTSSKSKEDLYQSVPLAERSTIRVLNLVSFDAVTGSLSYTLRCIPLYGGPKYYALSYSWLLPDIVPLETLKRPESNSITCNGFCIEIQPNLFDALLQLALLDERDAGSNDDPEFLWVDALCINQDDLKEREEQIMMMGWIYQKAVAVVVWLGRADAHSHIAIPVIETFCEGLERLEYEELEPAVMYAFNDPQFYQDAKIEEVSIAEWTSINRFFDRGWFQRMWIVQEVVMAREVTLLCGERFLLWDILEMFFGFIWSQQWARTLMQWSFAETKKRGSAFGADGIFVIAAVYHTKYENSIEGYEIGDAGQYLRSVFGFFNKDSFQAAKLAWLINLSRQRQVTEQRDRVYAMMNLVHNFHQMPEDWMVISPDYRSSESRVFLTFIKFLVTKLRNLNVVSLLHDDPSRRSKDFPSWASNCSTLGPPMSLIVMRDYPVLRDWQVHTPILTAGNELSALPLEGFCLDQTQKVGDDFESVISLCKISRILFLARDCHQTIDGSWLSYLAITLNAGLPDQVHFPTPEISSIMDAKQQFFNLLVLLLCDEIWVWHINEDSKVEEEAQVKTWWEFHADFAKLCATHQEIPSYEIVEARYLTHINAYKRAAEKSKKRIMSEWLDPGYNATVWKHTQPFMKSVEMLWSGRSLITTSKHGYLGVGSISARPSDEIWLLKGCKTPYILRLKVSNANSKIYELVGEIYVEQFVSEQVFQHINLDKPQSIVLV